MKLTDTDHPFDVTPLRASVGCLAIVAAATASVAFAPTAASAVSAAVMSIACTGSTTCVTGTNNSTGTGVSGISSKGIGTRGQSTSSFGLSGSSTSGVGLTATSSSNTGILASSTTGNGLVASTKAKRNVHAGVTGSDLANNGGVNDGVLGKTTNGGYGVEGTSTDGALGGVHGVATNRTGVLGDSSSSVGVFGRSNSGDGIEGSTSSESARGVLAINKNGYALEADGSDVALLGQSDSLPIILENTAGTSVFYVDGSGDVYSHGTFHTFDAGRNGAVTTAFTSRSAAPTVEDTGTAQLVRGSATVAFDPAFAASIDAHATYRVFLTPSGDTRGLFVSSKTQAGFVVRETQDGRGTLSFDYRIVAAAPGRTQQRMAIIDPHGASMPHLTPHRRPTASKPSLGGSADGSR